MDNISTKMQYNIGKESEAINDYICLLDAIDDTQLPYETKDKARLEIREIIADELDHQKILLNWFTQLTGISAKGT